MRTGRSNTPFRVPEKRLFRLDSSKRSIRKRTEGSTTKGLREETSDIDHTNKEPDPNTESDNETVLAATKAASCRCLEKPLPTVGRTWFSNVWRCRKAMFESNRMFQAQDID